jgi:hypothetical protein
MFAPTSLQTISLKRGIPARFKAVQEYEKRRKQESLAAGDHPALGQLEYGNADFKLALQPTKIITAHDIGCFKTPNELGIPVSVCSSIIGLLLHFGGFQDDMGRTFEDVPIPIRESLLTRSPSTGNRHPLSKLLWKIGCVNISLPCSTPILMVKGKPGISVEVWGTQKRIKTHR